LDGAVAYDQDHARRPGIALDRRQWRGVLVNIGELLEPSETTVRRLQSGQPLFSQGDAAAAVFGVEEGSVRLQRRTYDGRSVTLHTARAGELLAEASLFADCYHCDARALESARVRVFPKPNLLRAVCERPEVAQLLLEILAKQVQALRFAVELRNARSARDRLLLYIELKAGPDGAVALRRPLQDIAAEIGLTREALYRTLADCERRGVLRREAGSIQLLKRLDAA
jgi:CRP-like cAMP-binding protein